MALNFSDLKKGALILFNNQPHEVTWSQFVRMQQRKPVMQMKLRNLITGKMVEYSAKSGERIDEAEVQRQDGQYLYADTEGAHIMNTSSYETITIPPDISQEKVGFLKEGEEVQLLMFDGSPISIAPPIKVELKVKSTPPGVKGDTATGGTKPATLETGLIVNVPLFIKEGDTVRVNTETGQYVERVN